MKEKLSLVKEEKAPIIETTRSDVAMAEVKSILIERGAAEKAEQILVLYDLLAGYGETDESGLYPKDNGAFHKAEAAAQLLSLLEPSPPEKYLEAITPAADAAANNAQYKVAA